MIILLPSFHSLGVTFFRSFSPLCSWLYLTAMRDVKHWNDSLQGMMPSSTIPYSSWLATMLVMMDKRAYSGRRGFHGVDSSCVIVRPLSLLFRYMRLVCKWWQFLVYFKISSSLLLWTNQKDVKSMRIQVIKQQIQQLVYSFWF